MKYINKIIETKMHFMKPILFNLVSAPNQNDTLSA